MKNYLKKKRNSIYIYINKKGVKRLTNKWHTFKETGVDLIDDTHSYTTDLDIFGTSSLFQWIGAVYTFFGKKYLTSSLRGGLVEPEKIKETQDAVREMSSHLSFRQKIEIAGLQNPTIEDPEPIIRWAEKDSISIVNKRLFYIINILPIVSLLFLVSCFFILEVSILKHILAPLFLFTVFLYSIHFFLFIFHYKKCINLFKLFSKKYEKLSVYRDIIKVIEDTHFETLLLKKMHSKLLNPKKSFASQEINKLSSILTAADLRYGPLHHFILNLIWLWDIKCTLKLESWKAVNSLYIREWLEIIGHFENISSLSNIHFEHPSWTFPVIDSRQNIISAINIGHPLICQEDNIGNNFSVYDNKTIIVTGSNMSGKSTFLRTIAINLVLAYTGAPVCADRMTCSILNIITSMRTKDNLQSNVSTFYFELFRIKKMVDLVQSGERTAYFIDEIFNGTNSQDRITGAIAVLKVLQSENSIGFISTHDLELCNLANTIDSRFINYHFREYYENNQIKFDYKLYSGESKTRNALYLIKLAGIPITSV